jgi:hypothetical protein
MLACEMQIYYYNGVNILQELNCSSIIWQPFCGEFFFYFFFQYSEGFLQILFYVVDFHV